MVDGTPMSVDLGGVVLRNPVVLSAGTAGYLDEMSEVLDLARVGGVVTKSITRMPREGNATWRVLPAGVGMLNAVGLANVGVEAFVERMGPRVTGVPCAVIGSAAGFSVEEYVVVAASLDAVEGVKAVELNVSCPNVHGGVEFGSDPGLLRELVGAVRGVVKYSRLFVKLSPVVSGRVGISELARAAVEGCGVSGGPNGRPGADALCVANTIPAMAIDVRTRRPLLANVTGGLSGPAVHAAAVKLVYDVHRRVAREAGVPVIGVGGVMRWEDAAEMILAGATAVGMGTALFADPRSPIGVVRGLERWVRSQGASSVRELVGAVVV